MNTYSIYDLATGVFTGGKLTCASPFLDVNVKEGQSCLAGDYDCLREKVNVETGVVEAYQPPSPGANFVWDITTLSWVYVKDDLDLAREARVRRDTLLAAVDWVTLRAYRTNTPVPPSFALYQQALADIPTQDGFPRDIIWPTLPTE